MRHAAKVFMNNRSHAVRLPKEFQFTTREVFIRKQGGDVILPLGLQIGPPTLMRRQWLQTSS